VNTQEHINIFIVDDNTIFSLTLKGAIEIAFKGAFIKVHSFETGENCLKEFARVKPELVILDYHLNSINSGAENGLKVLDKIKKHDPKISVIMLTSNDDIDVALKSFHHGATDYVVKTETQFKKIINSVSTLFANKKLASQHEEKAKRAVELLIANNGLLIQNEEKEKWAEELVIARTQKVEIEKSKLVAEEKNKNITDSITYAKRIQQAQLPKMDEIHASFPDCFILFKPKDIVSGDFYFFYKNEHSVFIAVADCTGHGVPGALMSMIGSEKLNDAVSLSSDPSEILNRLNKGIKTSLRQSESLDSTKDGMDIALCSVNKKDYRLKYAGANRPLWVIRNGQNTIEEIKATKKAIGGFTEDNQQFSTHEIKLQERDTFYIFSDGYADQFGGEYGKKVMTRKFKEVLLEVRDKPMFEQEIYLDSFIESWKAGAEQVDDILVIGVRL
jgi:serine phosphatase RsbU (regulator of sigma subunit)